jgi:penicillin amidase
MIKRMLIWGLGALTTVMVLVVAYAGLTYWRATGGLPELDGTLTVDGLDAPAQVIRDEHGIPYIEASTERDLYFAQGFVHAQDRFWQMALARRSSQGRLAEWLGAIGLPSDRSARIWGWTQHAQRSWDALPNAERALLDAYAAGVNAWLEGPAYQRPPEMKILHVHPEPWRPEDAFLVSYPMWLRLQNGGSELRRSLALASGADSAAAEILDASRRPTRPIIASPDDDTLPGDGLITQATRPFKAGAMSNSWTLSGAHTASGLPLMANDPQLAQTLPGPWQLQHLAFEGRVAAGGTLPGLPGLGVGHNGAVAWGITAGMIDMVDVALLETHPEDPSRYRRGPEAPWQTFTERVETIAVRFGATHVDTIRSTTHGVIRTRRDDRPAWTRRTDVAEEIRAVPFDQPSTFPLTMLRMTRATTVAEGMAAAGGHTFPGLNISLADTAGTLGYVTAGRIPRRPARHALVVDAVPADDNDWTYLPADENPRVIDPPSGRIVTANQQIIGASYPHYLTGDWAPPWRAHRIHEVLDADSVHNVASFRAMQQDVLSPVAREMTPLLLAVEPASAADAKLVDVLRNWDARFELDAAGPIVFYTWMAALNRRLVADEMGALSPQWRNGLYLPALRALSGETPEWCDDVTTDEEETCAQVLRAALIDAREALEEAHGSDPAGWRWEVTGHADLAHLGFGALPVLGDLFSREVVLPGGPESLFLNGVGHLDAPRLTPATFQSSYQGIYDLADLDASLFMTGGGASGHLRSPYYNNLTAKWARGERIRLHPDARVPAHTLTLEPNGP